MAFKFFYITAGLILAMFIVSIYYRPLRLYNIIIGLTSVAYAMLYEIILGDRFKLYYYIDPKLSTLFIVLSAIFIYSTSNMIYTLFLPAKFRAVLAYTGFWIAAMLLLEYLSVQAGTIVFTGWKPVPWSFVTYIVTYGWIYFFYKYLRSKIVEQ